MAPERLPEPWFSFLSDIDRAATSEIVMHCIGGFAVSLHYGIGRATGDIDLAEVAPHAAKAWLTNTAGRDSALHRKHKVYAQVVTIATVPLLYEDRLIPIFAGQFEKLRLFVLDPYDLVLSKLPRALEIDFEDAKGLVRSMNLDLALIEHRYHEELRAYVTGPVERHDLTLKHWLEAFREERDRRTKG
jgi:hypothetical protein